MSFEDVGRRDFRDPWLWVFIAGLTLMYWDTDVTTVVSVPVMIIGGIVFSVRRRRRRAAEHSSRPRD